MFGNMFPILWPTRNLFGALVGTVVVVASWWVSELRAHTRDCLPLQMAKLCLVKHTFRNFYHSSASQNNCRCSCCWSQVAVSCPGAQLAPICCMLAGYANSVTRNKWHVRWHTEWAVATAVVNVLVVTKLFHLWYAAGVVGGQWNGNP